MTTTGLSGHPFDEDDPYPLHIVVDSPPSVSMPANQESQPENDQLARAEGELENLLTSARIGVLFLDRNLRLRRYTPPVQELFSIGPVDEGRPLSDVQEQIDYDEEGSLTEDAERVLDTHETIEREVQNHEDRWSLVRILPHRTGHDDVQGVVIAAIDITERKEAEIELRERNESLEAEVQRQTQRVRDLSSRLVLAEQAERDRIANILHDELQQELHAVQMCLNAMEGGDLVEEHADRIDQMHETLDAAIQWTRTLATDLSPPVLKTGSFVDVIERLALHMQDNHGLAVEVVSSMPCRVRDKEKRVLLFRLARELLFNVVKHAEVDEAQLRCRQPGDEQIAVEVIDEGKGFDVDALDVDQTEGFGLFSVRERLNMFGGDLDLESVPGEGTRATMVLPVGAEDDE